jgi:hypothetical protein
MPLQLCASGFAAARPLQLAIVAATRMTEFTSMWASSGGRAYRLTVRNGSLPTSSGGLGKKHVGHAVGSAKKRTTPETRR